MLDYSRKTILENSEVELLEGEITHQLSFKLSPDVVEVVDHIGLSALNQRLMERRPDCRLEKVNSDLFLMTLFIAQEGVFNDNIKYDLMQSALKDLKKLLSEELENV